MEFKDAIGSIIAAVVLLVPAVKWLINDWAKKSEQLEKERSKNTDKSLSRLENDVKDFRLAIDNIREQLRNMSANMTAHRSDISSLKLKLEETVKSLDAYSNSTNDRIKNQIRSEVTNLTQQLMMIRNKKNGN